MSSIALYRFTNGSKLTGPEIIHEDFHSFEDIDDEISKNGGDLKAFKEDDDAEIEFRMFVENFNKRTLKKIDEIFILDEAQGFVSEIHSANESDELMLQTELRIVPTTEVLSEMRNVIEDKRQRFSTLKSALSGVSRFLGLQK